MSTRAVVSCSGVNGGRSEWEEVVEPLPPHRITAYIPCIAPSIPSQHPLSSSLLFTYYSLHLSFNIPPISTSVSPFLLLTYTLSLLLSLSFSLSLALAQNFFSFSFSALSPFYLPPPSFLFSLLTSPTVCHYTAHKKCTGSILAKCTGATGDETHSKVQL